MNKILYLILFCILGILLYQILSNICGCKLTEGYGLFGRVNLDKCCPKGYKYSKTMKKCVAICDNCGPSVYNKLKLEMKQYPGDSQPQLHASFDCDEHDASTVYNYDSINRRYTKDDLRYNYHRDGWNMNSDFFTAGVSSASGVEDSTSDIQASEEGGNETWSGITGDAASGYSGTWRETSTDQQNYFEEIPEELYYTYREECIDDYTNFSSVPNKGNPPDAPGLYENGSLISSDCRGYWKLDMVDQRFDYLKDGDRSIAQPEWRVYTKRSGTSRNPGYSEAMKNVQNPPTFQDSKASNLPIVKRYIDEDILNPNSPVYEYYNNNYNKLKCVSPPVEDHPCTTGRMEEESEPITETLNNNRYQFCNKLNVENGKRILQDTDIAFANISLINVSGLNIDPSENSYPNMTNLCYGDTESKTNSWNTLCSNMDYNNINNSIPNAFIYMNTNENGESEGDAVNILCEARENIDYICPGIDEFTGDSSKTFCST